MASQPNKYLCMTVLPSPDSQDLSGNVRPAPLPRGQLNRLNLERGEKEHTPCLISFEAIVCFPNVPSV